MPSVIVFLLLDFIDFKAFRESSFLMTATIFIASFSASRDPSGYISNFHIA